jgi:hypothetical protein
VFSVPNKWVTYEEVEEGVFVERVVEEVYDPTEQDIVIETFAAMLRSATKDGGKKRAAGTKPPWWRDPVHEPALFSHLYKWKRGEARDKDSGAHPLVHLAWRALAIAYQETYGKADPQERATTLWLDNPTAPRSGKVDPKEREGK